jgi:hypothetical protein
MLHVQNRAYKQVCLLGSVFPHFGHISGARRQRPSHSQSQTLSIHFSRLGGGHQVYWYHRSQVRPILSRAQADLFHEALCSWRYPPLLFLLDDPRSNPMRYQQGLCICVSLSRSIQARGLYRNISHCASSIAFLSCLGRTLGTSAIAVGVFSLDILSRSSSQVERDKRAEPALTAAPSIDGIERAAPSRPTCPPISSWLPRPVPAPSGFAL